VSTHLGHLSVARARSRKYRAPSGGLALVAAGFLVAACSSSPKTPGVAGLKSTSTTAGQASGQTAINQGDFLAKMLAYTNCMRGHGIPDFPDPTPGPNGQGGGFSISAGPGSDLDPTSPRFEAANRACQPLLPYGGSLPAPTPQQLAEEMKFAACIREHGFPTWPDPNSKGVFVIHNFDMSSPEFQSTEKTCHSTSKFTGPMGVQATNSGPNAPAQH